MITNLVIYSFPIALVLGGATDLLTLKIPNRIPLLLTIGFVASALIMEVSPAEFLSHFGAALTITILGFVIFCCGWAGGGDVKLMATAALWLGFDNLLPYLFWTAILGGTLAVLVLAYRRMLLPICLLRQPWAMRLHDAKEGIPYGVAIAGAGLIVYPQTIWMTGIAG